MTTYVYDCEVFQYDWLIVFKNTVTGYYTIIHNDNEALRDIINNDSIYVGFNSKGYDQYIVKAIVAGFTPEEIKQVNDYIIGGKQGWECPLLQDIPFYFNNVDIMNDIQIGLSLKAIEGHLGMNIRESTVPFDIGRPLTKEELQETIFYCKHDVDTTEKLITIRKDYLKTKLNLGKRANIKEVKSLASTNAKLTAMMLHATRKEWNDGRNYVYPSNLDKSVIPKEVLDFFDTIHDTSIPDEKLFKTKLEIDIGGMPCKYAWGGVHGSLKGYYEQSSENRVIQNKDVSSLYPSLIEHYNYLSRNVPNPKLFYEIKRERITAKHNGDKQTANDLKLPLNTVSGAQDNQYNDLYDPLPTRSLRISGQLFLTVLTMRLLNVCKTIKLLNLNTDGLMYSIDKEELPLVESIASEWEKQTKFELETDDISSVWIKDVNNLLMIKTNGDVKKVGAYLNYGISVKGAWAINNSMIIVKKALTEYFVNNVSVEDTINKCNDLFQFQIIAKAGSKYNESYQMVNGKKISIQKINRVYATHDKTYGTLYKVKSENGQIAKIEMLPEHCIIDNDKTTKKADNVYLKLLKARAAFAKESIQKTGKNMYMAFKYFELSDIVPSAISIFTEVGLIPIVNFTNDTATMLIIDCDNPADFISFSAPFNQISPIISNSKGTNATNEMQALGASITYMRRYLYIIALDICENDEIDANIGSPTIHTEPPKQNKVPITPEDRKNVKIALTDTEANATDLQIEALKTVLKKLRESDPSQEDFIQQLALNTKGFTVLSKTECEDYINCITDMLGVKS